MQLRGFRVILPYIFDGGFVFKDYDWGKIPFYVKTDIFIKCNS